MVIRRVSRTESHLYEKLSFRTDAYNDDDDDDGNDFEDGWLADESPKQSRSIQNYVHTKKDTLLDNGRNGKNLLVLFDDQAQLRAGKEEEEEKAHSASRKGPLGINGETSSKQLKTDKQSKECGSEEWGLKRPRCAVSDNAIDLEENLNYQLYDNQQSGNVRMEISLVSELVSEEEVTRYSDEAIAGTSDDEKSIQRAKKQKVSANGPVNGEAQPTTVAKKVKKRPVNVWAKTTSRKGNKKHTKNGGAQQARAKEEHVLLTPVYRNQEKIEDGPDLPVVLSKFHKAEKVELSIDRLSAGSTKGYRMVRATRGITDGAWYFEITVEKLGPTGHTRLGWSTQKGELQAPVGFDSNSYAYRDTDGSKVHKARPEPYGMGYVEGDVIGFYINLPHGAELAPKQPPLVAYRGHPFMLEAKEEPLKVVPGSEITFFRNGVCQGTAFTDIIAERYFPAASMYTLPNEPNCTVRFCFGPDFRFPPEDMGQRPVPQALCFAPHCGLDAQELGTSPWGGELSAVVVPQMEESKNKDL